MKRTEQETKLALSAIAIRSRNVLVQTKCQRAIAKIRAAQTLIAQAEATLLWAEHYQPPNPETI